MQLSKGGSKKYVQTTNTSNIYFDEKMTSTLNSRSRSPLDQSYIRRSPMRMDQTMESYGELLYLDPNEGNFRRTAAMSPRATTRISEMRSPNMLGQSVVSAVRNDLNDRNDTAQIMGRRPIPTLTMNIERNHERLERSPKTINIGDTKEEIEYNIRTLNQRRSPRTNSNYNTGNYNNMSMYNNMNNGMINGNQSGQIIYQNYQSFNQNDPGNIFLDQPMLQGSFIQGENQINYTMGSPMNMQSMQSMGSPGIPIHGNVDYLSGNSREIQYNMNPRDLNEQSIGTGKMSPKGNVEDESTSDIKQSDIPQTQLKDLKSQMDRNQNVLIRPDADGMVEGVRPIQNDMEKIEDYVRTKDQRENMTEAEVKKLIKQMTKGYDPNKGREGRLISTSQTVIPSANEDIFNDRYKVLQKMNKLSSILLSKNRSISQSPDTIGRTIDEKRKTFDRNTLNSTLAGKKNTRTNQNKFLYVTLAMLSSKGTNTEDRTILRRMRFEKGGVVDLAQEAFKKKEQFKIKKVAKKTGGKSMINVNPKFREKAAKIVQGWWRGLKEKYEGVLQKIIKIQSYWRGRWLRKYMYDIIYLSMLHQRFCETIEHALVRHVRPMVWDEIFSQTKWRKDALTKILLEKDKKLSLIRAIPYLKRWYDKSHLIKNRLEKGRKLVDRRENDELKKKKLKKYLDEWSLKANCLKYMSKSKNAEAQKKKFFGAFDMINGLTKLSKREGLISAEPKLKDYLSEIIKKLKLKKLLKKKGRFLQNDLRNGLDRWKRVINKLQLKDFRHGIIKNKVERLDSRMDKIKLKKYFDKWKKQIPNNKLLNYLQGAEMLERFCLRTAYEDPLSAIKEKTEYELERDGILRAFGVKERYIKHNWRDYLIRWKDKAMKAKNREIHDKLYKTLVETIFKKYRMRVLSKRFHQWRQRPKIDLEALFNKYKLMSKILNKIARDAILPHEEEFMKKITKVKAKRALDKAGSKLLSKYLNKDKNILRHFFFKWREQCNNYEIRDLKVQLIKYLYQNKEIRNKKLKLGRYLTRWKLFCASGKHYDNIEKLKRVREGFDKLHKIYDNRALTIFVRLYRKMNKDFRPQFLNSIYTRLNKPRSTIRECLNRWRRVNEREKAKESILNLKAKFIKQNAKRVKERTNRDLLLKAFFKWKHECRKPEEYYPKIVKGLNLLKHYVNNSDCKVPFNKLKSSKNYQRRLNPILKNRNKNENRIKKDILRKTLNKWRKNVNLNEIKNLKSEIILKTKHDLKRNNDIKLLSKYFTRWKLYRRKGLDYKFYKGLMLIQNKARKESFKNVFKTMKIKVNSVEKNKGLTSVFKTSSSYKKNLLHNALLKWFRNAAKIDPNKFRKIKTRLRRILKEKEGKPLSQTFRIWQYKTKKIQLREKDIDKAKKMIGNTIRQNDKMIKNRYFSNWKKKIHQIREAYLKSLLVKQIKNSQTLKEKANDKARLHAALLKWRANLTPTNYLDNLKRIRRGCQLLKRGLKKRDEPQIYSGIKERAKNRRINHLLKIMINKIKPRINLLDEEKAFKIWTSKLPDTNRMKNKIKDLFERYVPSQKIHKDVFEEPKKIIIESIQNYNTIKKNKANNIQDFFKKILNSKNSVNRMKLTLLLNKIIKNKNNALKNKAKIVLLRYHRIVQTLRNNKNANIIQRFLKARLTKPADRRKKIVDGAELMSKFTKKYMFKKVFESGKNKHIGKTLLNHINKQDFINKKLLTDAFTKWKNLMPILKNNEAALKIQNAFRNLKSKKKRDDLKTRNIKINTIFEKNDYDRKKKNQYYLRKWLRNAMLLKSENNIKTIQLYLRQNLEKYNKKISQNKLQNLFKKNIKHQLNNLMSKASRIIGGKGEAMFKTLEDIYIKRPYNILRNGLKTISRQKAILKVQPKIKNSLEKHFIPKYLNKWKNNTYDVSVKNIETITTWLKKKKNIKKEKDNIKKNDFLTKQIKKIQKDKEIALRIPFSLWARKVRMEKMGKAVNRIQNAFRNYILKKEEDKLDAMEKFQRLFKGSAIREISDILIEANRYMTPLKKSMSKMKSQIEKRYATNNILSSVNNNLRIKYLQSLSTKRAYTDAVSALKRYVNKWQQYCSFTNKSANKIQNAFRNYKAKNEMNRLKNINISLNKFVTRKNNKNSNKLSTTLRKWNNKARLIGVNQKTKIIQRYLRPKIAKKLNDKFKDYYIKHAQKLAGKRILQALKFYKLKQTLQKISMPNITTGLKENTRKLDIKNLLNKRYIKLNEDLKNLNLKTYLDRWRNQKEKVNEKREKNSTLIQSIFRGLKSRRKLNRLKGINDRLNRAILRKTNNINNKIRLALYKWKNNANVRKFNDSSKVIQSFMSEIRKKMDNRREMLRQRKIQKGLDKMFKIKFGCKDAFDKIKSNGEEKTLNNFFNKLTERRTNTIKETYDKIKNQAKNNLLRKIMRIPENLRNRIYKKIIDTWKTNTDKLNNKFAASLIQKNWKLYSIRTRKNKIHDKLNDILNKLNNKKNNIVHTYLQKWSKKVESMKIKRAASRINRYVIKRFKLANARQNWNNLSQKYVIKKRNYNIGNIIDKLRKIVVIKKITKTVIHYARDNVFTKLNDILRKRKIIEILKKIYTTSHKGSNNLNLKDTINKWNDKVKRINERENLFNKALNSIDIRRKIIALDTYSKVSLLKKLLHDIPRIRALDFLQKLKKNAENKRKFEKLGKTLNKSKKDIIDQSKQQLIERIMKLYVYKKLEQLDNTCKNYVKKTIKPLYAKEFLEKLYNNLSKKTQYEYKGEQTSSHQTPVTKLSFKSHSTAPNKQIKLKQNDKSAPIKKILPFFVKYLEKKIQNRKKETMERLKKNDLYTRFCKLYKNYSNKKMIEPKIELVTNMKEKSDYMDKTGPLLNKLFSLFRRKYVRHISESMVEPNRMYLLIYLIRMSKMHQNVAKNRFLRELIRKWRFAAFVKKMARKKLELMYKNLHYSYLQMANEVFGDEDEMNPSVIKEFERFGSNLGMFSAEEPSMNEEMSKKYYTTVQKKYVFGPTVVEGNPINEMNSRVESRIERIEDSAIQNSDYHIEDLDKTSNSRDMSIDWMSKYKKHK